jgi:hypothetical protein
VSFLIRMPLVPFKLNQNGRHHIRKRCGGGTLRRGIAL